MELILRHIRPTDVSMTVFSMNGYMNYTSYYEENQDGKMFPNRYDDITRNVGHDQSTNEDKYQASTPKEINTTKSCDHSVSSSHPIDLKSDAEIPINQSLHAWLQSESELVLKPKTQVVQWYRESDKQEAKPRDKKAIIKELCEKPLANFAKFLERIGPSPPSNQTADDVTGTSQGQTEGQADQELCSCDSPKLNGVGEQSGLNEDRVEENGQQNQASTEDKSADKQVGNTVTFESDSLNKAKFPISITEAGPKASKPEPLDPLSAFKDEMKMEINKIIPKIDQILQTIDKAVPNDGTGPLTDDGSKKYERNQHIEKYAKCLLKKVVRLTLRNTELRYSDIESLKSRTKSYLKDLCLAAQAPVANDTDDSSIFQTVQQNLPSDNLSPISKAVQKGCLNTTGRSSSSKRTVEAKIANDISMSVTANATQVINDYVNSLNEKYLNTAANSAVSLSLERKSSSSIAELTNCAAAKELGDEELSRIARVSASSIRSPANHGQIMDAVNHVIDCVMDESVDRLFSVMVKDVQEQVDSFRASENIESAMQLEDLLCADYPTHGNCIRAYTLSQWLAEHLKTIVNKYSNLYERLMREAVINQYIDTIVTNAALMSSVTLTRNIKSFADDQENDQVRSNQQTQCLDIATQFIDRIVNGVRQYLTDEEIESPEVMNHLKSIKLMDVFSMTLNYALKQLDLDTENINSLKTNILRPVLEETMPTTAPSTEDVEKTILKMIRIVSEKLKNGALETACDKVAHKLYLKICKDYKSITNTKKLDKKKVLKINE